MITHRQAPPVGKLSTENVSEIAKTRAYVAQCMDVVEASRVEVLKAADVLKSARAELSARIQEASDARSDLIHMLALPDLETARDTLIHTAQR